jgi:signal transduction histidine kinase
VTRRPILIVIAALAVALAALAVVGKRVLERDREELYEHYANERLQGIDEAARALTDDVAEIGEDLELAATLLHNAESPKVAERELHAIATIKREYLMMEARTSDGSTKRVVAFDAPAGIDAQAADVLVRMLDDATREPGRLHASGAPQAGDVLGPWFRVFARQPEKDGPTVGVVVDTRLLLSGLKLQPATTLKLLVYNPNGDVAPVSDQRLVKLASTRTSALGALRDAARDGHAANTTLSPEVAASIGLPRTVAVAIAVPLRIDQATPWSLIVVTSTTALAAQEQTLVRRVLVGAVLVLGLLLSAAGYVIHSALRAATLRERLRQAERLSHSEKLVTAGQLAAGIAHEIGTPLNVARGRVELVLSHLGKDHAEAANHGIVIEQIDRVTRLIQQLLDYVRPVPASMHQVDIKRTMHVVADLLSAQASKRGVTLRADVPPDIPELRGDPDQVQQILVNIVLNAIDACDEGGRVEMRASRRGDAVIIEVLDNGHGISPEIRAQIFDPFFTTKKRGQGTGLGLWVVAQLVRAHAAEIDVESTLGSGTTVRLTWPVPS